MTNLLTDLVVGLEEGQTVDQEASLEELGVDPAVEGQPLVDLACVEVLAVPMAQQEGEDVGWPQGGAGCHLVVPCPQCLRCLTHLCIPPPPPLLPPLQELTDLKKKKQNTVYRHANEEVLGK